MRPSALRQLLAVLLLWLPALASAAPSGYATGFIELYRVTLASGQAVRIGGPSAIGFNDVEGLALSAQGVLFGVADASMRVGGNNSATTDFLIRIDTTTGVGALVGQLPGLQGQGPGGNLDYGLAFTCDGRLWMSSETTGNLWEVDPVTAAVRLVGNTGASLSGLAARGNTLYGVSIDPNPQLYRIDPANAFASAVGPLGVGGVVANAGLDFDANGALWATLDPEPVQVGLSRLVRIDPFTGTATLVGTVNVALGMEGLAIAPTGGCNSEAGAVPVPGPALPLLALLGLLCAGVGMRRLSRR